MQSIRRPPLGQADGDVTMLTYKDISYSYRRVANKSFPPPLRKLSFHPQTYRLSCQLQFMTNDKLIFYHFYVPFTDSGAF